MTTQALLVSFGAFSAACLTLWTFRLVSAESSQAESPSGRNWDALRKDFFHDNPHAMSRKLCGFCTLFVPIFQSMPSTPNGRLSELLSLKWDERGELHAIDKINLLQVLKKFCLMIFSSPIPPTTPSIQQNQSHDSLSQVNLLLIDRIASKSPAQSSQTPSRSLVDLTLDNSY